MIGRVVVVACAAVGFGAGARADVAPLQMNGDFSRGIVTPLQGLRSFRDMQPGSSLVTAGDTYGAALIGQSTAGAALITNASGRVTTFTYDLMASLHGTLAGSNATVNIGESELSLAPGTFRIIVDVMTADSSDLWINGLTIGGQPMTQGRVDVGAGAFTNGILWDNNPAIASLTITNVLFIDGAAVATSSPLVNGRTLPEMGSVVVWNGVVGSGVDESQMIFDLVIPAPGCAAMLGALGLVQLRRRRV